LIGDRARWSLTGATLARFRTSTGAMCGIAGYVNWAGKPVSAEILKRMVGALRHRGPDDDGVFIDQCAGLAHARLSILDIAGGHQPMSTEDGRFSITFNGEIFNYLELRCELQARGHRFATRSDTEVILHAFQEKGERCVDDFNGQWAFAIWDAHERRLFLSRDRIGVLPLFHTTIADAFVFASEIKGLFHHPCVRRELDVRGLDQTFTFWSTIPPRTPFRDVRELPPGHSMTVTEASARETRYWALEYSAQDASGLEHNEDEAAEELLEILRDATRVRLRSDVPVGAYVSGGLDSAAVTALIAGHTTTPLRTFSVTFDDPRLDEREYQEQVVESLDTDHTGFRCSRDDIAAVFPEVVWHAERPLLRTAPAPMFLLSRLVRRHDFKVVLTGEGADELFGGYDLFKEVKIRRFCAAQPDSRRRPLLLKRLYPYLPELQLQSTAYLQAFFGVDVGDADSPFFSHLPRWNLTSGLKRFLSPEIRSQLVDFDACSELRVGLPDSYDRWDGFSRAQYLEASSLLPGYILSSQSDRVAMAHSVESRYPFLDHRVIEFANRLPPRLKMKALSEKYLLKRSVARLVPETIRRRKKQPYRAPDAKSFVGSTDVRVHHDYVNDLLSPRTVHAYGVFAPDAVQGLVRKARSNQVLTARDDMALVGILSTQLLVQRFIHEFN
jgi:asparagine synthase (glutamine-hydrolysing)